MNKISFYLPIVVLFLSLVTCSKQEDEMIEEDYINSIRTELEEVIAKRNVSQLWGQSVEVCSSIAFYEGSPDFEFMDYFLRIEDKYFQYDRLVSFEVDTFGSESQMLLCFN